MLRRILAGAGIVAGIALAAVFVAAVWLGIEVMQGLAKWLAIFAQGAAL
jgi:hypothetical protein